MARKRSKIFSERELEVMKAVWKLEKATVKEIREEMGGEKAGAYTSIATMLKLLENKGALRHEQEGRAYYYIPTTTREEEQRKAVRYVLNGFFEGDSARLMQCVEDFVRMNPQDREEENSEMLADEDENDRFDQELSRQPSLG